MINYLTKIKMASTERKGKIDEFAMHNSDPDDWTELARAQGHTGSKNRVDETTGQTTAEIASAMGGATNGLSPLPEPTPKK